MAEPARKLSPNKLPPLAKRSSQTGNIIDLNRKKRNLRKVQLADQRAKTDQELDPLLKDLSRAIGKKVKEKTKNIASLREIGQSAKRIQEEDSTIEEETEQAAMRGLQLAKTEIEGRLSKKDKNLLSRLAERTSIIIRANTKLEAIRQGVLIGLDLRRSIENDRFDGFPFMIILTLSLVKDIVVDFPNAAGDTVTVGLVTLTLGSIANIAISFILITFFLGRSYFIKRLFIRRFLIAVPLEFIPFASLIPNYTIMTILLKLKIDKARKKKQRELEELEKTLDQLAA